MEENDRGSPKLSLTDLSSSLATININSSSSSSSTLTRNNRNSNTHDNNNGTSNPIRDTTTPSSPSVTIYNPPSLVLLSAITVADHIQTLLIQEPEKFYYITEENCLLILTLIIQNMKLTPKIVLGLREIAKERGYSILLKILQNLDISSGIILTSNSVCNDPYF